MSQDQGEGFEIQTLSSDGDERAHRAAIKAYFAVPSAARDPDDVRRRYLEGMKSLFHEDAIQDLVQSGERIRGLDKMMELVTRHPDFPQSAKVRRILGTGDLFVVEARLMYDQGAFWEAMLMEFRGDKVAKSTEFYAQESEPPEGRSQWVERI